MSAEGTKMPEPVAWWTDRKIGQKDKLLERGEVATNPEYVRVHKEWLWVPIYTADQMRAYAQQATRLAMERCAEICDWTPSGVGDNKRCADALRALADVDAKEKGESNG